MNSFKRRRSAFSIKIPGPPHGRRWVAPLSPGWSDEVMTHQHETGLGNAPCLGWENCASTFAARCGTSREPGDSLLTDLLAAADESNAIDEEAVGLAASCWWRGTRASPRKSNSACSSSICTNGRSDRLGGRALLPLIAVGAGRGDFASGSGISPAPSGHLRNSAPAERSAHGRDKYRSPARPGGSREKEAMPQPEAKTSQHARRFSKTNRGASKQTNG